MRIRRLLATLAVLVAVLAPSAVATAQADLNCADFAYQEDAQDVYDADPTDPNGLDADNDGIACEDRPHRPAAVTTTTTTTVPDTTPTTGADSSGCNPNYSGACVPVLVEDVDCAGGTGNGPAFVEETNFEVVGEDIFGLDADGDGIACEVDLVIEDPPLTPSSVATRSASSSGIPSTGIDSGKWAAEGVLVLLVGGILVHAGRRRGWPHRR